MRVQGLRVTESQWHHRSVKGLGQPNAPNFEVCLGKRSINISPLCQVKRPMAMVHLSCLRLGGLFFKNTALYDTVVNI